MEIVSFIIHAYMYLLIYELMTEEHENRVKWYFAVLIGIVKSVAHSIVIIRHLLPLMICTLMIIYSMVTHSKNSNLKNLNCAVVAYGVDYIFNVVLGSVVGLIAGLVEVWGTDWRIILSIIIRITIIMVLNKMNNPFKTLKQVRAFYIAKVMAIVLLLLDQVLCLAYSTDNRGFGYVAISCIYMVALFTTLWLLDHYKMAKIQKMYADDNQQMSQKLHRSKEILPMIANYVSTMDGTPDEGMRKKLEEVCHDYGKELGGTQMCAEFIETTGIDLVDLLLRTKIIECGEQDIELNVFVSTQIAEDMKRMDISDGEITRLMGDLLRNAINAVSKLQNRMILLLIARDENDCVLIRIYDSGIPFPPYVLERFGERGNTTWGTGNGIADMMETLRRVHASIEINMDMDAGDVFTKGIFICFDGEDNVNITQRKEYPGDAEGRVCF